MTYQIIYSSQATIPMQSEDLEELLVQARGSNARRGISGALVYCEGTFLQILEGERAALEDLMATIVVDLRHEAVTILREGEVPSAKFASWKMAYLSATSEQVTKWAGIGQTSRRGERAIRTTDEAVRTARFADDILSLLQPDAAG